MIKRKKPTSLAEIRDMNTPEAVELMRAELRRPSAEYKSKPGAARESWIC
jgi:hypothetical protein